MIVYFAFTAEEKPNNGERLRQAMIDFDSRKGLGFGAEVIRSAAEVRDKGGKPRFPGLPGLEVSVTHTKGLWACAVSCRPVGMDAERWDRKIDGAALAARYFAPEEQEYLTGGKEPDTDRGKKEWNPDGVARTRSGVDADDDFDAGGRDSLQCGDRAFLQIWTRKEAYLKYLGTGLAGGLKEAPAVSGGALTPSPAPGLRFWDVDLSGEYLVVCCGYEEDPPELVVEI